MSAIFVRKASHFITALRGRPYLNIALIAGTGLLSRLLGLVRDRLLASTYGAGPVTDAYVAAFRLPDLVFQTLVLGAFAAACVPLLVRVRKHGVTALTGTKENARLSEDEAVNFFSSVTLNWLAAATTVGALLLAAAAHWIVPLLVPGFAPETVALATGMTRIMLCAVPLFTVSSVFSALLTAEHRFWSASWTPVAYNVGILAGIAGAIFFGQPLVLAAGVALGALLHVSVPLPELLSSGWRYAAAAKGISSWCYQPFLKELWLSMVPRTLALGVAQITQAAMTFFLSAFGAGKVSAFYFSSNVQSVPLGLIGVSFSFVAFPILAHAHTDGKDGEFESHLMKNLSLMLFFLVPISALMLVLRAHAVRLLLGAGAFDWEATYVTAQTLGLLSLAVIPQSLIPLLTKALFAKGDTKTPLYVSAATFAAIAFGSWIAGNYFGYYGVVATYCAAVWIDAALLLRAVNETVPGAARRAFGIMRNAGFAAVLAGGISYGALQLADGIFDNATAIGLLLQSGTALFAGMAAYAIYQGWARPEAWTVLASYAKRIRRLRWSKDAGAC